MNEMATPDRIRISRLDVGAVIGVGDDERAMSQRLSIDVEFTTDARNAARSDSIADAIDYSQVARTVAEVCGSREFHLIETLAEEIAARILAGFPVSEVRLVIRKISPLPAPKAAHVSIAIVRP